MFANVHHQRNRRAVASLELLHFLAHDMREWTHKTRLVALWASKDLLVNGLGTISLHLLSPLPVMVPLAARPASLARLPVATHPKMIPRRSQIAESATKIRLNATCIAARRSFVTMPSESRMVFFVASETMPAAMDNSTTISSTLKLLVKRLFAANIENVSCPATSPILMDRSEQIAAIYHSTSPHSFFKSSILPRRSTVT